jgi:hypothetical protein
MPGGSGAAASGGSSTTWSGGFGDSIKALTEVPMGVVNDWFSIISYGLIRMAEEYVKVGVAGMDYQSRLPMHLASGLFDTTRQEYISAYMSVDKDRIVSPGNASS